MSRVMRCSIGRFRADDGKYPALGRGEVSAKLILFAGLGTERIYTQLRVKRLVKSETSVVHASYKAWADSSIESEAWEGPRQSRDQLPGWMLDAAQVTHTALKPDLCLGWILQIRFAFIFILSGPGYEASPQG